MVETLFTATALCFLTGCSSPFDVGREPNFVSIRDGSVIAIERLDQYAEAHNLTREAAREEMGKNNLKRRAASHARTYGISEEEALQQIVFSIENSEIPFVQHVNQDSKRPIE